MATTLCTEYQFNLALLLKTRSTSGNMTKNKEVMFVKIQIQSSPHSIFLVTPLPENRQYNSLYEKIIPLCYFVLLQSSRVCCLSQHL